MQQQCPVFVDKFLTSPNCGAGSAYLWNDRSPIWKTEKGLYNYIVIATYFRQKYVIWPTPGLDKSWSSPLCSWDKNTQYQFLLLCEEYFWLKRRRGERMRRRRTRRGCAGWPPPSGPWTDVWRRRVAVGRTVTINFFQPSDCRICRRSEKEVDMSSLWKVIKKINKMNNFSTEGVVSLSQAFRDSPQNGSFVVFFWLLNYTFPFWSLNVLCT